MLLMTLIPHDNQRPKVCCVLCRLFASRTKANCDAFLRNGVSLHVRILPMADVEITPARFLHHAKTYPRCNVYRVLCKTKSTEKTCEIRCSEKNCTVESGVILSPAAPTTFR